MRAHPTHPPPFSRHGSVDTRNCCDAAMSLILRRNNVLCPMGKRRNNVLQDVVRSHFNVQILYLFIINLSDLYSLI